MILLRVYPFLMPIGFLFGPMPASYVYCRLILFFKSSPARNGKKVPSQCNFTKTKCRGNQRGDNVCICIKLQVAIKLAFVHIRRQRFVVVFHLIIKCHLLVIILSSHRTGFSSWSIIVAISGGSSPRVSSWRRSVFIASNLSSTLILLLWPKCGTYTKHQKQKDYKQGRCPDPTFSLPFVWVICKD